jgi:hypothetical protein
MDMSRRGQLMRSRREILLFPLVNVSTPSDLPALTDANTTPEEWSSLLHPGRIGKPTEKQTKLVKAILYAVQVFYSFFIM